MQIGSGRFSAPMALETELGPNECEGVSEWHFPASSSTQRM